MKRILLGIVFSSLTLIFFSCGKKTSKDISTEKQTLTSSVEREVDEIFSEIEIQCNKIVEIFSSKADQLTKHQAIMINNILNINKSNVDASYDEKYDLEDEDNDAELEKEVEEIAKNIEAQSMKLIPIFASNLDKLDLLETKLSEFENKLKKHIEEKFGADVFKL